MAEGGSSTATAVAIAAGTVVGLFLLSRFSGPGANVTGGTPGTTVPPGTVPGTVLPGTILPPITAENLGHDVGILLTYLVDAGPEFVDGLLKAAGAGTLLKAGGIVWAWYYKRQLVGYFVRGTTAAAAWTFKQVIRFVRGGGTPPPAGGAPAPVAPPQPAPQPAPAPQPVPQPAPQPSVPQPSVDQSTIQATITRIRQALESGVAPVTRDVQNLVSWIGSGIAPKTAVLAALGATAITALFRLAPAVASLAPLAAALA